MATSTLNIKYGWVWALTLLVFFFNTFLLPEGFTYTLLLTPVWMYLLFLQHRTRVALKFFIPLIIYALIHLILGVDIKYYLVSITIMASVIIFITAMSYYLRRDIIDLDGIFRDVAILNFFFAIGSIAFVFSPISRDIVWYTVPVSQRIVFPRLKLFTEEASHYSFLLAPIVIYFYSRVMFFRTERPLLMLFIVTLPLALSFSLGVLLAIIGSGLLILIIYFNRIFSNPKKRNGVLLFMGLLLIAFFIAYRYFPNNVLFTRFHNIFTGDDTSARGRTYEAFILAHKIIAQKSYWWGIGPGQLKLIGRNIIVQYYQYFNIPNVIRIPNAMAETIVCFGYVGFILRLFIETTLFFATKVYRNPYRLWLFVFVFVYQFTGSYITNIAEYLVWLIVFSPVFPEYIREQRKIKRETA